jgi:hypothetical protein
MPKYKITIWDTTAQYARCIIEASSEAAAVQTARQLMWNGDDNKLEWVVDEGDWDFDVAFVPDDTEPNFREEDYKEEDK